MTNEQKERLKEMLRESFSVPTEDADFLCGLLDRQPSEEHLKLINMVLSQINSREMWATRADYEMARMALDRIRKALNIEAKE